MKDGLIILISLITPKCICISNHYFVCFKYIFSIIFKSLKNKINSQIQDHNTCPNVHKSSVYALNGDVLSHGGIFNVSEILLDLPSYIILQLLPSEHAPHTINLFPFKPPAYYNNIVITNLLNFILNLF